MFRRNPRALSLMLLVAAGACSDSMTAPEMDTAPPVLFSHTAEAGGGHLYDFNAFEPTDCGMEVASYEDLTFGPGMTCFLTMPEGEALALRPGETGAGSSIQLPQEASSVQFEVDWFVPSFPAIEFSALDAASNVLETQVFTAPGTVLFEGLGPIASIVISATAAVGWFDDLVVEYIGGEGSSDPADKDACKLGGWEAFGFSNQGQCVSFVETGKDARL